MRTHRLAGGVRGRWIPVACALVCATAAVLAQAPEEKTRMDIYGFTMLDIGYDARQVDPNWFDVLRPTKLPAFEDQFGRDGRTYASVRQSRFGVKTWIPTRAGEVRTIFEFELFGVGPDAGQTTFRLRHAWGEFNVWGAGQTWSPFMDPDVFPNSLEYWGPPGMVFFRNVQVRWMPLQGANEFFLALERPGASGDPGVLVGTPEFAAADLSGRFPYPDVSSHYKRKGDWGHVQIAAIGRRMAWDDRDPNGPDLSGNEFGWGVNLSSVLKFHEDFLRLQVAYGEGIANYMNDATADVGAVFGADVGEALPLIGIVAFYDRTWSKKFSSSIGYSMLDFDNSEAQDPSTFERGDYALVNLKYQPTENLMWGGELQWGRRENFDDGFDVDDYRLQVSVRYNFAHTIGGKS
jgi:hypothetical protein